MREAALHVLLALHMRGGVRSQAASARNDKQDKRFTSCIDSRSCPTQRCIFPAVFFRRGEFVIHT